MNRHYFIMSRRYECGACRENAHRTKQTFAAAAKAAGLVLLKVDGVKIWPKLPVYLRTYYKIFNAINESRMLFSRLKTARQSCGN